MTDAVLTRILQDPDVQLDPATPGWVTGRGEGPPVVPEFAIVPLRAGRPSSPPS